MNAATNAVARAKSAINTHRVAITAVSTAVITTVVVKKVVGAQVEAMKDFLQSEGLLEKFQNNLNNM